MTVASTYSDLLASCDTEGLLHYGPGRTRLPTELERLTAAGLIRPYLGSYSRLLYVWLPAVRKEPDWADSLLPPPSIQNGAVLQAYVRRDRSLCHLCGGQVQFTGRYREAFPSLDHLTPRVQGGSNYPSNIATSHTSCNKARRDQPVAVARAREQQRTPPWWRR